MDEIDAPMRGDPACVSLQFYAGGILYVYMP